MGLDPNMIEAALWLGVSALVLLVLLVARGREGVRSAETRQLSAFRDLRRVVGESAEKGGAIHIALGGGGIAGEDAMVSLAGFQLLEALAADLVSYHIPTIISVGDPTLLPLAQDVLRRAYEMRGLPDSYDPNQVRFVAPSPVAYAAGAAQFLESEDVVASVIIGAFGAEVSLIMEAASRRGISQVAAAAAPQAVGVLYPATEHLAIGEQLFAAGAQTSGLRRYVTSLEVQDVLRLVLIAAIPVSALATFLRGSV